MTIHRKLVSCALLLALVSVGTGCGAAIKSAKNAGEPSGAGGNAGRLAEKGVGAAGDGTAPSGANEGIDEAFDPAGACRDSSNITPILSGEAEYGAPADGKGVLPHYQTLRLDCAVELWREAGMSGSDTLAGAWSLAVSASGGQMPKDLEDSWNRAFLVYAATTEFLAERLDDAAQDAPPGPCRRAIEAYQDNVRAQAELTNRGAPAAGTLLLQADLDDLRRLHRKGDDLYGRLGKRCF